MIIAIDFDGTCVTHDYPRIGKDIKAVPVLRRLVDCGHLIILYTMRDGKELEEAVDWFKNRGISLLAVNNNPAQAKWTKSPKVFAHIYIDDAALGCPTITNTAISSRVFVDWAAVEEYLDQMGLFGKYRIPNYGS